MSEGRTLNLALNGDDVSRLEDLRKAEDVAPNTSDMLRYLIRRAHAALSSDKRKKDIESFRGRKGALKTTHR